MHSKDKLLKKWQDNKIIKDKKVLAAFKKIPRELFVGIENLDQAYGDYPLPIGESQTISQPTTVMLMTQALELKPSDKVLEIGTGSGYQTAIIAYIVKKGKVISTEIIKTLSKLAGCNLEKLRFKNVELLDIDGSKGYEKEAPYDKIIITAGCPKIPGPLIKQLKENSIIVAPVGNMIEQSMIKARKINGKLVEENIGTFMFVPLKGKHGHK